MAPILGSVFWTPKWGPLFGPILQLPGKFLLAGIGPLKGNRRQRKHTTCCNLMTSSEHAAGAILVPMLLQTVESCTWCSESLLTDCNDFLYRFELHLFHLMSLYSGRWSLPLVSLVLQMWATCALTTAAWAKKAIFCQRQVGRKCFEMRKVLQRMVY